MMTMMKTTLVVLQLLSIFASAEAWDKANYGLRRLDISDDLHMARRVRRLHDNSKTSKSTIDTNSTSTNSTSTNITSSKTSKSIIDTNATITEITTLSSGKSAKQYKSAPTKRNCGIKEKTDKVEFKCKAETETDDGSEIEDEIKFTVSSKDEEPLTVTIEYEQEIQAVVNDTETETETATKFEVEFDRIIEYRKANTTANMTNTTGNKSDTDESANAFDWEEDIIVQEFEISDWTAFAPVMGDANSSTFSISTEDGVVTFNFTIAHADTNNVTANEMKIDFDLNNFPWNSTDTYVALICSIESERSIEVEFSDTSSGSPPGTTKTATDVKISFDDAVDTVGFTPFGAYTWVDYAEVSDDNSTSNMTAVVATSSTEDNSTEIAFSFVGASAMTASDIFWDPQAGIGYGDELVTADEPDDDEGDSSSPPATGDNTDPNLNTDSDTGGGGGTEDDAADDGNNDRSSSVSVTGPFGVVSCVVLLIAGAPAALAMLG